MDKYEGRHVEYEVVKEGSRHVVRIFDRVAWATLDLLDLNDFLDAAEKFKKYRDPEEEPLGAWPPSNSIDVMDPRLREDPDGK